jgi:hypothetical protein
MVKKSVNIGKVKGETPRKVFYFNKGEAPNEIESATPERAFFADDMPLQGVLKKITIPIAEEPAADSYASPQADGRPSTSRGKQRPTPEEFADYVVPSPDRTTQGGSPLQGKVLVFDGDGAQQGVNNSNNRNNDVKQQQQQQQQIENDEELVAVGCWLFGSALSV